MNEIHKLDRLPVALFILGHTKYKGKKDTLTNDEYEQIDYDIDFEEPEDFSEEQDNGYFDIKDENEPEESEFSEIEAQADETELSEDDFEIKDETEDDSDENESQETENDFEIEDFDSEENFIEPEEEQEISFENEDYQENVPAENFKLKNFPFLVCFF